MGAFENRWERLFFLKGEGLNFFGGLCLRKVFFFVCSFGCVCLRKGYMRERYIYIYFI